MFEGMFYIQILKKKKKDLILWIYLGGGEGCLEKLPSKSHEEKGSECKSQGFGGGDKKEGMRKWSPLEHLLSGRGLRKLKP